LSLVGLSSLV